MVRKRRCVHVVLRHPRLSRIETYCTALEIVFLVPTMTGNTAHTRAHSRSTARDCRKARSLKRGCSCTVASTTQRA